MNPQMVKQAMKKLGIRQEEIEASRVIIQTKEKNIIILNPSVTKINMQGMLKASCFCRRGRKKGHANVHRS